MEETIPPEMATARGWRLSAPAPMPTATGSTPAIVDTAVIRMGRRLFLAQCGFCQSFATLRHTDPLQSPFHRHHGVLDLGLYGSFEPFQPVRSLRATAMTSSSDRGRKFSVPSGIRSVKMGASNETGRQNVNICQLRLNVINLTDRLVSREEFALRRSMISGIFSSWPYGFNGSLKNMLKVGYQ